MSDLSKLPSPAPGCTPTGVTPNSHEFDAFHLRFGTATADAVKTGSVQHPTNNDETLYTDKSATYSKCLKQVGPGLVDPVIFGKFRTALNTDGNFQAQGPLLGNIFPPGIPLNGPQGAFALAASGVDSRAFVSPPPPKVASKEYAVELVELYWASLLRDVPFTAYEGNATAIAAANELDAFGAAYSGPRDTNGKVTARVLFRGGLNGTAYFPGETIGPYLSQLCIHPTTLGAQTINQMLTTYAPGIDFMIEPTEWHNIQNGAQPTKTITRDPQPRFIYDGRGLGAYTHVDELYQAYFTAYLLLESLGVPANKTSPYSPFNPNHYINERAFGTFGGPDIAATLAAVARAALNAVWYQKWVVHLRHRPESGGGLVHLIMTGKGNTILTKAGNQHDTLDKAILDSEALKLSYLRYNSYLLSQAFPEGAPPHPAYPTGHGAVAGACITVLKFFYEGSTPMALLAPIVQPSCDGLTLEPYNGADAGQLTVNTELNKLAHNISFGHGIHAGIHWRSDTDWSIILGEQVALKFLQDQAYAYNENIDIKLTKLDGTSITISNH